MSDICGICGKKINVFFSDGSLGNPLTNIMPEHKACVKCSNILNKICYAKNIDDISNEINFVSRAKDNHNINSAVKEYIERLILETEHITSEKCIMDIMDEAIDNQTQERVDRINEIKTTSGYNFENYNIVEYFTFISAEIAMGLGLFKGISASFSNMFGLESESLRGKLVSAKDTVMRELKTQAFEMNANAIIGVDLDYTMFGDTIVAVILSGTAVHIEPNTLNS